MIVGMAIKTLSEVEVNYWASNQHEFNGVTSLKRIFGMERQYFNAKFAYMSDKGIERKGRGTLTWYDARENHPNRTEYRLYYDSSMPLEKASAGDTLLITIDSDGLVNVIIIARGTQLVNFLVSQIRRGLGYNYNILTESDDIVAIANILNLWYEIDIINHNGNGLKNCLRYVSGNILATENQ